MTTAPKLHPFTVAGYWNDDDTRVVTSVMAGDIQVTGGDNVSEGGPFAEFIMATSHDTAEAMVNGTGPDAKFDCTPGEAATLSHKEAQELHESIGRALTHIQEDAVTDRGELTPLLERALELAALVVSDSAAAEGIEI